MMTFYEVALFVMNQISLSRLLTVFICALREPQGLRAPKSDLCKRLRFFSGV